jgi:hypothetical protein
VKKPRDVFLRVDTGDSGAVAKASFVTELPDDAEFLVCMKVEGELILPDNATGTCSTCSAAIQFRPAALLKPKLTRVCVECALAMTGPKQ